MFRNVLKKIMRKARSISTRSCDLEINRIVWMDMEMTGLNVDKDAIMEVACLVTDSDLNIIAEGPNIVIHQTNEMLDNMHEWCIKQHGKTGLTEACRKSNVTVSQAEDTLLEFLSKQVTESASPLAGNSVYMDRIIDVSTIKELCRRWNSAVYKAVPKKEFSHRALEDIKESVAEMRFYKKNFFKV